MKVLKVTKFNTGDVKKFIDAASNAGSDNGLSPNYLTVPLPVISEKKITNGTGSYGAFDTALFTEDGKFIKTGSMSVNSMVRTFRVCEEWDKLPEDCTMEMIQQLPMVDFIEGSNRATGKSIFELMAEMHKKKEVIVFKDKAKVINQNFLNSVPVVEGTTIRERNLFTKEVNADIYKQLPDILAEIYSETDDAEVKKYFDAAGIDYKPNRGKQA